MKRRLAKGGAAALLVKVASAGLSFVMFIYIARGMTPEGFALFGFGFSAATLIVLGGSVGQRTAALRFVPVYEERSSLAAQRGHVRRGYGIVTAGCITLALLFVVVSNSVSALTGGAYAWAVAFFAVVLGVAEYQAHVLRGHGKIILALAPREVLWRAIVTVLFALPAFALIPKISATYGFVVISIFLLLLMIVQGMAHPATKPKAIFFDSVDTSEQALWLRSGAFFWGTGLLRAATPNVAMLLIGAMLPHEGGAFFAALRLAMVVNLVLVASSMLSMPMLSAAHERGDMDAVRVICRFVAILTSLPALMFFGFFIFTGDQMMGLYSEQFAFAHWALVLIAFGYLIKALCGPGPALLQMMGQESQFLKLSLWVSGISVTSLVPMIWAFGLYGAAFATGFELALTGVMAWRLAQLRLGVDPSIFSVFNFGKQSQ